ncbi:hypothetical protein BFP97_07695 [Roseivirga sp. 4D4]|uniref:M56 family metallopeptidase n=1 Tax=Roseivirga sp. 4D4 TaxID=1889784 RepID=UPI0008531243|nr:M56 family metallopeptidase [Roseivirga sp. 4D4]OEK01408.1 hypothetical protein BFP97_07695 [Roseivirga sp. 4D4]
MMIYILKFIGCSGLLLLFYYGVLQNDRLFRFNRFFLLAIVAIALIVPLTVVKTKIIEVPVAQEVQTYDNPIGIESLNYAPPLTELTHEPETAFSIPWESVLWAIYALITAILLIRFTRNLLTITRLKDKAHIISDKGIKIVLREDIRASFSFLNLMYTNKMRYEQGNLPDEIIEHEKHHITQKHSYDIIYIEFVQCLLWFNPFIYFIKKAIKLNHEFLADQHVLKRQSSAYEYQKILLDITRKQLALTPAFASNLNYGFTKKRLNMMTKNTNKFKSMIKQIAAAGIIAGTFWIGGETRLIAQEVAVDLNAKLEPNVKLDTQAKLMVKSNFLDSITLDLKPKLKFELQDTTKGVRIKQFGVILKGRRVRFNDENGQQIEKQYNELSEAEKERFKNPDAKPQFYLPPPPPSYMDQKILDDFFDTEKYGVWLNGKNVENSRLKDYSPNDFYYYTKSRLGRNAKNYGKHVFQLDIVTREHYETLPNSKGSWIDYQRPIIIEIPEQKSAKEKVKNKPQIKEIPEVKELKEVPDVFEIEEVPEVYETAEVPSKGKPQSVKEKPAVIKVKPKADLKEVPKVKEVKAKEKNQAVREKEKDLDQRLAHLIPLTVRFKNRNGQYVEKSFGQLSLSEKEVLISEAGEGKYLVGIWKEKSVKSDQLEKHYDQEKYRLNIDDKQANLSQIKNLDAESLVSFWIAPSSGFLPQELITIWTEAYFKENYELTDKGLLWAKLSTMELSGI